MTLLTSLNNLNAIKKSSFLLRSSVFTGICLISISQQVAAQSLESLGAGGVDPALIQQFSQQSKSQTVDPRAQNTFQQPAQISQRRETIESAEEEALSYIEKNYAQRMGIEIDDDEAEPLKQYGYDNLSASETSLYQNYNGGAVGGGVSNNYVLGAGDQLTISFRGQESSTEYVTVSNSGQVLLSSMEPVAVSGMTLADFEQRLRELAEERFGETEVFATLTSVRQRQVMLLGEVAKPGAQQLSAFASVMDALAAGGGIKKTGSLRQVLIIRDGQRIPIDLYNILLGNTQGNDQTLQDGDRIVVPGIGRTVAISGAVARPGIYELAPGEQQVSTATALRYAGNPIQGQNNRLVLSRINSKGEVRQEVGNTGTIPAASILLVQQNNQRRQSDITIERAKEDIQQRALVSGMTVKSLLNNVEALPDDTYLPFAAIVGRNETRPINLYSVLVTGDSDYPMQSGDRLVLLSREDIRYLWSADVRDVLQNKTLTRLKLPDENENDKGDQQNIPQEEEEKLLDKALFVTERKAVGEEKENSVKATATCRGLSALMHVVETEGENRFSAVQRGLSNNKLRAYAAEVEQTTISRYQPCPDVFQRHGDLLPLLLDNSIAIMGAVQIPGAYPVAGDIDLKKILTVAGGVSRDADRNNIQLNRRYFGNGSKTEQRVAVAINTLDATVKINAGDSVVVRREPDKASVGTVRLEGQFNRPGIYEVRANETLTSLVERAGGLTELSYPYGAIFAREKIRKVEQAGYERVARQMESSLLANLANLRNGGASAGLVLQAVNQNIEKMREAKALGRMVIQADPDQLYAEPNLDILLEDGDYLYMPKRPSYVMVSGEVLNAGAMQFQSDLTAEDYLEQAGGFQKGADKKRVFVILPNGKAKPIKLSFWNREEVKIPPGSTIVVPQNPVQVGFFRSLADFGSVASQFAVTAASLAVIGRD